MRKSFIYILLQWKMYFTCCYGEILSICKKNWKSGAKYLKIAPFWAFGDIFEIICTNILPQTLEQIAQVALASKEMLSNTYFQLKPRRNPYKPQISLMFGLSGPFLPHILTQELPKVANRPRKIFLIWWPFKFQRLILTISSLKQTIISIKSKN